MFRSTLFTLAILAHALPQQATACLWDSDTLQQERARFPSTLEIITGKFLRHSPEFYEWRIKDRTEKLKADQLFDECSLAPMSSQVAGIEHALAVGLDQETVSVEP